MADEIAIIGAGLSGLSLALALHRQNIPCTVYESRPMPLNIGGAVMLSPNALRIMDQLSIYQSVRSKGYNFTHLDFETTSGQRIDTYEFGSHDKYGYHANRIYRHELITILLDQLSLLGVPIKYNHKFSHIISETTASVTFAFTASSSASAPVSASLLIGADGIHSTVRTSLFPTLEPTFTGIVGITAAIPTAQITFPTGTPPLQPLTLLHPTNGAFVLAPQRVDASEFLIGKQKRLSSTPNAPPPTREELKALQNDKTASIAFLRANADSFGIIGVSATSHIEPNRINVWPFFIIPRLERWTSTQRVDGMERMGRVIVLGDAAHAVPPSAGQGINQAFEDGWMFALLLGGIRETRSGSVGQGEGKRLEKALQYWQRFRQDRVDRVLELNRQIDARRLPRGSGEDEYVKALAEKKFELEWLYEIDYEKVVAEYWDVEGKW